MRILAITHQRDAGPGVFAEAIRERGDTLETWLPVEDPEPPADPLGYDGVFSLGGAMHPDQQDSHPWMKAERELLAELLAAGTPTIGLCLGAQLLAGAAGAEPRRCDRPEIGWHPVALTAAGRRDPLLTSLSPGFEAFQWHSYRFPLPAGRRRPGRRRRRPAGVPDRRRRLGDPVPRRGQCRRRRELDRRLPL